MKTLKSLFALMLILPASAVLAETMIEDTDESGSFNFLEITAAYPELSQDTFDLIDVDKDGEISATELQAAFDADLLKS